MSNPSPNPDAGRMRYRKLRIAWSVFWGLAAILLIALWVRSYVRVDTLDRKTQSGIVTIRLGHGQLRYMRFSHPKPAVALDVQQALGLREGVSTNSANEWSKETISGFLGFGWKQVTKYQLEATAPLWPAILLTTALAAAPWLRWFKRFSLRTLLIATTLVAVILGAIVYAAK
jgi:hypothetical protein